MGLRETKNTKAHIFKIIHVPVFIDLKYIHGFQNSTSIMKQKTETNFPEFPIPKCSKFVHARFASTAQDLRAPQPLCLHRKAAPVQALRLHHGEGI